MKREEPITSDWSLNDYLWDHFSAVDFLFDLMDEADRDEYYRITEIAKPIIRDTHQRIDEVCDLIEKELGNITITAEWFEGKTMPKKVVFRRGKASRKKPEA